MDTGWSDLARMIKSSRERRDRFNDWLLNVDESVIREIVYDLKKYLEEKHGYELNNAIHYQFSRFLEIGDTAVVNSRVYRIARIESDYSRTTSVSVELVCDNHIIALGSIHRSRTGPLWDTSRVPNDNAYWEGQRGNCAGVRGVDPGVEVEEGSTEDINIFKNEVVEVVVGLVLSAKVRLQHNKQ